MAEIEKLDLKSKNITEEQRVKLRELFPEVFAEDKIDFDKLRMTLGDDVDAGEERFGMTWPGKRDCFKVLQEPSIATLKPCKEESVNWYTTENLFIEGDNLEVLKQLQKSYYGKIKMIYIDPPYNTGKEFIYPDKYSESLGTYLAYTGQVDAEGYKFSTNTEAEGRFHSNWLNMMYPRLFLSRNLLSEDGVIFISIDEHEVDNLAKLCNEIFGEECFIALITVLCNPKGRSQDKYFATNNEYVMVYSRNLLPKGSFSIEKDYDQIDAEYTEEDEDGKFRALELRNTHREFGKHNRKNLFYPLFVDPDSGTVHLEASSNLIEVLPVWDDGYEGCWTWDTKKAAKDLDFLVGREVNGRWKVYRKSYANGAEKMLKTIFLDKDYYTERGQRTFNQLFDSRDKIFQSPKSHLLISQLVATSTTANSIILDFFAGSCTTAHAVLELNKDDSSNRKFIVVQLPEPCDEESEAVKAGYKTIADLGKERIRRVIKQIQADKEEQKQNPSLFDGQQENKGAEVSQDLGFRVFKLDKSNFKVWDGDVEDIPIEQQLAMAIDHIDFESTEEDILNEILLKSGFELTTPIEELTLEGKKVYSIAEGALLICLEKELTKEVIRAIAEKEPHRVVCLDSGFAGNDQLKTNTVQIMKSFNVESFRTV